MNELYDYSENVILLTADNLPINAPLQQKEKAKEFVGKVLTIAFGNRFSNGIYYITKELPRVWIKEEYLEPIIKVTQDEFDKLIEV